MKTQDKRRLRALAGKRAHETGRKMHLNIPRRTRDDDAWLEFRVPPSQAQPKAVFTSCHYCGYDSKVIPEDGTCPKCGGHSWERNAISVRLLPTTKTTNEQ